MKKKKTLENLNYFFNSSNFELNDNSELIDVKITIFNSLYINKKYLIFYLYNDYFNKM